MRLIKYTLLVIGSFFLSAETVVADDYGFAKTEDGIFKALTTKKKPLFTLRNADDGNATPLFEVRGLTVLPRDKGQEKFIERTVSIPQEKAGETVNLAVHFAVNSHAIQAGSLTVLDNLGAALKHPELVSKTISVNGHTDHDGSEQSNLRLSLKRAIAVKQYLNLNHGITNDRLRLMGYGEGVPLVENTSNQNKQLNRRVEISVVKQ
jgi:outer membrane protein OmpA-like peptidoglycan-associated protein